MSHNFTLNASQHAILLRIDDELALSTQKRGCPACGGTLHQADYPRSPMGIPAKMRVYYEQRNSFCCRICRKRTTSKSVRFFGRRWYPEPLFILISALRFGPSARRCTQIQKHFGITMSACTWKRWRLWWATVFAQTDFWKQAKGIVPISHFNGPFPRVLLSLFSGTLEEKFILLFRFFAPITAGALRAV